MKIKGILLLALTLAMLASCAAAQQLPGVDVFSPGLVRLSDKMSEDPAVHMEADLSAVDAFYVRDLSVFSQMLEGTTFVYDGAAGESGWTDQLAIERGGEKLFSGAMTGNAVEINGEAFALGEDALPAANAREQAALEFVQNTAILERAPLAQVESFLLSLKKGDELFAGYAVVEPFTSVQTMSDDGTRLTRINLSGSIAREGEAPWMIKGYLKQPAGRAPKDTFELTATQDEDNYLELSYSSTRQSEITKKNKAGKASVDTHVKVAGKIGGYRVSERLTSYLRNTWTADGENLDEKIVVSMTLEHQDNTPGREMQRTNLVESKLRHEIRLTTAEAGNDVFDLTDAITLSVVMDENTVLDVSADAAMTIGGKANAAPVTAPDAAASAQAIDEAWRQAAQEIARSVYGQLGEKTREKILEGLNNDQ